MSDKVFILLIVVLIGLGVFSYQKALHERGGITPLQELLQGRSRDDSDDKLWANKIESLDMQQEILNAREQVEEVALKKKELIDQSGKDLSALLQSNQKILSLAQDYLRNILEEYKQLQQQQDMLLALDKEVIALSEWTDTAKQQSAYEAKSAQIVNVLNALQVPADRMDFIERILEETRQILTDSFEANRLGCGDLVKCVSQNINTLEQQVNEYLDERVISPANQLKDLIELRNILDHEYKFLIANTQGTDERIQENNKIIKDALDEALGKFDELTSDDIARLLKFSNTAHQELDKALINIKEHHEEFQQRLKESGGIQQTIISNLQRSTYINFKDIVDSFKEEQARNMEIYAALQEKGSVLLDLWPQAMKSDEKIIETLAEHLQIDLNDLRYELGFTQPGGAPVSPDVVEEGYETPGFNRDETLPQPLITTQDQTESLRQKADRDEETLKRMFEIYGAPIK